MKNSFAPLYGANELIYYKNMNDRDEEEIISASTHMFQLPISANNDLANMDLKTINDSIEFITKLLEDFLQSYNSLIKKGYPADLLRAHLEVIQSLANYQITLIEMQNKRQGHIKQESDVQEVMGQIDNMMKNNFGQDS